MASSLSNTPFSALFQATQQGRYITFFMLVGDISCRQVIFHVGRRYFTSSSKSRNTREISDIFHFAAIHFLPEENGINRYINCGGRGEGGGGGGAAIIC